MRSEQNLIAQNTEFGWVISGACNTRDPNVRIVTLLTNVELQQSLKRFFESDEFDNERSNDLTDEELYCEEHYKRTVRRTSDGRFVVSLPFKFEMTQPEIGDSRRCAIATQLQL